LVSIVMRAPMVARPLSADEGGYLAIARAWAQGRALYADAWVDRPQGLLVLYRLVDWISGGNPAGVRVMGLLAGCVMIVATSIAVNAVAGQRAAAIAAVLTGLISACPVIEGYAANGELLTGALVTASIATALVANRGGARMGDWLVAGVLAGASLTLKQSGFEAIVAFAGFLIVRAITKATRRDAVRRLVAFAVGSTIPIGGLLIHAAIIGWDRWWWAIYAYRAQTQSLWASADWGNLQRTAKFAAPILAVAAIASVVTLVRGARRVWRRPGWVIGPQALLGIWLGAAIIGFLSGGGFWHHYWVQLVAPLSALAATELAKLRAPHRQAVLVIALGPTLAFAVWVYTAPRTDWSQRATGDWRAHLNEEVGLWFAHRHIGQPNLYVMCASAGMYASTNAIPGYPYLWFAEVRHGRYAAERLADYLADDQRGPDFVARVQSVNACDPSGRTEKVLQRDFHQVDTVGPVVILQRDHRSG